MTIADYFKKYKTLIDIENVENLPMKFTTSSVIDTEPDSILYFGFYKPKKKTVTLEFLRQVFPAFPEDGILKSLDMLDTLGFIKYSEEQETYSLV